MRVQAHRLEFERFRVADQLAELQASLSQELPGLEMGMVLAEKKELAARVADLAPRVEGLQAEIAGLKSAGTDLEVRLCTARTTPLSTPLSRDGMCCVLPAAC